MLKCRVWSIGTVVGNGEMVVRSPSIYFRRGLRDQFRPEHVVGIP